MVYKHRVEMKASLVDLRYRVADYRLPSLTIEQFSAGSRAETESDQRGN